MTIQTRLKTGNWRDNGEPIHISVIDGAPVEKQLGRLSNVSFTNIDATGENGGVIYGDHPGVIENLRFNHVRFHLTNGQLQDEYGGNFDLRLLIELSKNLFKHDIAGIYIRNADSVVLNQVLVTWDNNMSTHLNHGLWTEEVTNINLKYSEFKALKLGNDAVRLDQTTFANEE